MISHSRHLVTRSGRWSGMLRSVLNWKLDTPSKRNTFQCHLIMKKSPRARFVIGETSWYLNIDSVFLYFSNQTHRVISAFCIYQLATSWMRHNFWEMFSVVTNILQCLGRGFGWFQKKNEKEKSHHEMIGLPNPVHWKSICQWQMGGLSLRCSMSKDHWDGLAEEAQVSPATCLWVHVSTHVNLLWPLIKLRKQIHNMP